MSTFTNEESFEINTVGEVTGTSYLGVFTVKLRLSHIEKLRQDQLRRQYIGPSPDGVRPSELAENTANIFSTLHVRLVKEVPSWWKSSNNGLELQDDNVVAEVYDKAMTIVIKHLEGLSKKAEGAVDEMKKDVSTQG